MATFEIPGTSAQETRTPAPEGSKRERMERQEQISLLREKLLDQLLLLETIRKGRKSMKTSDIQALDVLVKIVPAPLDPRAMKEVRDQLTIEEEACDMASTVISFIEILNDEERRLHESVGVSEDSMDQESEVRKRHADVLKKEWGVS